MQGQVAVETEPDVFIQWGTGCAEEYWKVADRAKRRSRIGYGITFNLIII